MIWEACQGENHIRLLSGSLYRLVESQEQVATMGFVDTLDEQAVLEELLESAKPNYPDDVSGLDYLLTTPFRYPPLKWGSRFGGTSEPSLFYGGCSPDVTLAESAYYRFVFFTSIEGDFGGDKMRSEHTMFSVDYRTTAGIKLHQAPFNQYQAELTHPLNYSHAQTLGTAMRAAGVTAFEYMSARDVNNGHCVGLFDSSPFVQNRPQDKTQWLCETDANQVTFKQLGSRFTDHFSINNFMIDGVLPLPA